MSNSVVVMTNAPVKLRGVVFLNSFIFPLPAIIESNLFYVWWVDSSSTACTTPEVDSDDADSVITGVALSDITASNPPLTSEASPLSFPSDIDGSSFTLQDVLDRVTTDICGGDAIDHTELKLCMAVDTIQEIALDGTVTIQINEATDALEKGLIAGRAILEFD